MALMIDGGRVPPRWAEKKSLCPLRLIDHYDPGTEYVRIALINNMPDPALEDTEMQFMELLDAASGQIPVRLKLYSLPRVPRGDRGLQHLTSFYSGIGDLWNSQFDAVIMTGTEPRQPDLREEPYWCVLAEVLDWAERNTVSTVLSCLAAHASVLHSDGIRRQPLSDKRFGVFESARVCHHELTQHASRAMRFPHSRWNEVREGSLTSCGYTVLTKSAKAGVDLFVKQKKQSLFVHFQGHPEYGSRTLFKEYRRDIKNSCGRKEKPTRRCRTDTLTQTRRNCWPSFKRPLFPIGTKNNWCSFPKRSLPMRCRTPGKRQLPASIATGCSTCWRRKLRYRRSW